MLAQRRLASEGHNTPKEAYRPSSASAPLLSVRVSDVKKLMPNWIEVKRTSHTASDSGSSGTIRVKASILISFPRASPALLVSARNACEQYASIRTSGKSLDGADSAPADQRFYRRRLHRVLAKDWFVAAIAPQKAESLSLADPFSTNPPTRAQCPNHIPQLSNRMFSFHTSTTYTGARILQPRAGEEGMRGEMRR